MLQVITRRLKLFKHGKRGISTVIVVMLSLVLIVVIVGNVVLWSYQMNQLDMERMQETLSLINATRITRSSWSIAQREYITSAGSKLSGTFVDTTAADSLAETFREELEGIYSYNPSSYTLGGATSYVLGDISDLALSDGVCMNFRSYMSSSPANDKTDAFVAYRDSTTSLNTPKWRVWDGESLTWNSQSELPTANSSVRWVRVAYSPLESRSYEKIVVTLSDDGYLDAYVWNGAAWNVTSNIAFPGTSANAYRCFDVAYEKTSGRALLVYSRGTTTNEIGYRRWTPETGWGPEQLLDLPYTSGIVRWISLASSPGARAGTSDDNEIAMIYLDANNDVHGYVWTGSAWSLMGATAIWDATAATSTRECIAVAYEQTTGEAMFIWADSGSNRFYYRTWNGATLSAATLLTITATGGAGYWVTLKADPASDDMLFLVIDSGADLNTAYWNGSTWTVHTEHDDTVDTNARRCADFAWEPSGGKGLLVWGTTTGQIAYKTFVAPNAWGTQQNIAMGGASNIHPWVQLRTNPRNVPDDVLILGLVLEGTAYDLGAISWDGATLTVLGSSVISANTTVITYECFELEFANFGVPTFTCEVEFSGKSDVKNWTQLLWAAALSFTVPDVTTTFQLYNYNLGQYPTSGSGYITDTIGQTTVPKNQTIPVSSTDFRDANGNWKMKITGTKITYTQFEMHVDWIEFKPTLFDVYRLNVVNNFAVDLSTYPREHIQGLELLIKYKVSESSERWFLKAYNWRAAAFSDVGFNVTAGSQPILGEWTEYAIAVTDDWADYVNEEGLVRVELFDEGTGANQTVLEIDFFAVRVIIDATRIDVKNSSPISVRIVAVWVINSTMHQRYDVDMLLNAGEAATYIRADIKMPQDTFLAKVVTERGNVAVFSKD
ncbi:MAG: hypothetical protein WHU54_00945 [Candidatus Bathyarchaeia archaeon]|jgi:hypothetical protein